MPANTLGAPATAPLTPLTHNGSSGGSSMGVVILAGLGSPRPGAGGGSGQGRWAHGPAHTRVLRLTGYGRALARHLARVPGKGICLRSHPTLPQTRQKEQALEEGHDGAEQLICRHRYLSTVCYK